jgi:hypothetical protein
MNDTFDIRGRVTLQAICPRTGRVIFEERGNNVVTGWLAEDGGPPTSGRDLMRRMLIPSSMDGSLANLDTTAVDTVKLGTGTTPAQSTDTDLEAEIAGSEKAVSSVELDATNPYVTFVFEWGESEVNTDITEAVLYSGRGDALARRVFFFPKNSSYLLRLKWQLRF